MKAAHSALSSMLVAIVLLAPAAMRAPVATAEGQEATVLGAEALTVRACPELSCDEIGTIQMGDTVVLTGEAEDGFAPVKGNGVEGWAYALYLFSEDDDYLIQGGVAGCNRVALIFNAGIGEEPSKRILDTLTTTETPATLFAMGWWAEAYPDYLQAMADAGVAIGSHGDTQTLLTTVDDESVVAEVQESAAAIEDVIDEEPEHLFTPYATDTDPRVGRIIAEQGYLPIRWTVAAADYNDDDTEEDVYDRVMSGVEDGAIVELHLDGPATEQSTALALPRIIADLEAQGYTLVTVPELLLPCGASAE